MTEFRRGDVVLVVFTDGSGEKRRPAVVLSSGRYHSGRQEVVIAPITSQTESLAFGDHLIGDWQKAGLLFPSLATGILKTVKQDVIVRKLGTMSYPDMQAIENNLRDILQIGLTLS
ncbi:MAG: type II toxin-antitoxin system PemK/MazF family toxin [Chloroflexi bacterium]|nr:type II toxin-antitoxin system PemK/MazF family toxin [Chloroflexota bacterium]